MTSSKRTAARVDGREGRRAKSSAVSLASRESFATSLDGTRLYVRQAHPSDAPSRVSAVLCDGILCDGFIWKYLFEGLAARMPVAHWHYRGHGRSQCPQDPDFIDIAAHASDLTRVRAHIGGGPAVLFGHSMGCQVVLEGYREQAEGIRGMVLVCGSYGRITETFRGTNVLAQLLPKLLEMVEKNPEWARALWSRVPPELALKSALLLREVNPEAIAPDDLLPYLRHMTHVDIGLFLRMLRAAGEHDAEDLLPKIDVPVLVIAGSRDSFTPPFLAERMVELLPKGELLLIEGGTHVAPLEHRDLVKERIDDFLDRLGG